MHLLLDKKECLQLAFEGFQMTYADLSEEHKTVMKQLRDADNQLVASMQQIQTLNRDRERKQKELDELEAAKRALVDVVDPNISGHTLLERLHDAPRSITNYAAGIAKVALTHVLALASHISHPWI
jgi:hypothetical protein